MGIGDYTNFKIYDEQYYGGQYEVAAQMLDAFNAASQNAIQLVSKEILGHYSKEAFLQHIADLIARRDIGDTGAATDKPMTQEELISVKINRMIGPVAQTLDAWRKIGADQKEMSYKLGKMVMQSKLQDYLNTGVLAVEAAIEGVAALNFDATGETTKTLTHEHLVSGLAKMGDAANKVLAWVSHSKPVFDLLKQSISDKIFGVANLVILEGTPATLGRPIIVTDAPALHDDNGSLTDTYNVLGLVPGAVVVTESEIEEIISEVVTGLKNLVFRIQGEYAFNVECKGYKWDTTAGGINPTDAALGTTTNWDQVATSVKDLAGLRIKVE